MTHELKHIVIAAFRNQSQGLKNVLATVVDLDGSSYRGPGVRMLLSNHGATVGAVSGGCVEKEVFKNAQSVFKTGKAKIMTYDGRYRLGCEGVLYILLEPITISAELNLQFAKSFEARKAITIESFYKKKAGCIGNFYSQVSFNETAVFTFSPSKQSALEPNIKVFRQTLPPCFQLLIVGGEHDAVKLCKMASLLGWAVHVVTSIKDSKTLGSFPGAQIVTSSTPDNFSLNLLDAHTAVVLMTHNYAQDLLYLLKIKDVKLPYVGLLGSAKRRDQLQQDLFNHAEDFQESFLDSVHSPAGLNLGAITPEEIALSILSEILSVIRHKEPFSLRSISGKIHAKL